MHTLETKTTYQTTLTCTTAFYFIFKGSHGAIDLYVFMCKSYYALSKLLICNYLHNVFPHLYLIILNLLSLWV